MCVCVCMYMICVSAGVHMPQCVRESSPSMSQFSPSTVRHRNRTQDVRPQWRVPLPAETYH